MTIQLEEGKFYQTREGAVLGPYTQHETFADLMWVPGDHSSARFRNGHSDPDGPTDSDLVAEWPSGKIEVYSSNDPLPDLGVDRMLAGSSAEVDRTDVKTYIADEAKRIVSGARRSAYGKPEQNFARIAALWTGYANAKGWPIEFTAADVSPLMRLMKEARIIETPNHLDSHVDLVGYSLTGAEVNGVTPPA